MASIEPADSNFSKPCLRTYGRTDVALRGSLESPLGRAPCLIHDISLGGARIETEQKLAPDHSIWLSIRKLKIFGTVRWVSGELVGVQFEEKLPKSIVLNLRGEVVDPEALAEMEALLAAQNWVIGTPIDRPKSVRLAEVLGAVGRPGDNPLTSAPRRSEGLVPERALKDRSGNQRAAAVIVMSAAIGLLIGLGSIFIF